MGVRGGFKLFYQFRSNNIPFKTSTTTSPAKPTTTTKSASTTTTKKSASTTTTTTKSASTTTTTKTTLTTTINNFMYLQFRLDLPLNLELTSSLSVLSNGDLVAGARDKYVNCNGFVSCSYILIFNVINGNVKKMIPDTYPYPINEFFELSNGYLACSSYQVIKIWDINKTELVQNISAHSNEVKLIKLKNGDLLSASDDNRMKIWRSTNQLYSLHQDYVYKNPEKIISFLELSDGHIAFSQLYRNMGNWQYGLTIKNVYTGGVFITIDINSDNDYPNYAMLEISSGYLAIGFGKKIFVYNIETSFYPIRTKEIMFNDLPMISSLLSLSNGDLIIGSPQGITVWNYQDEIVRKNIIISKVSNSNKTYLANLMNGYYAHAFLQDNQIIVNKIV